MGRPRKNIEDLYIPEPNSGCFLWTGAINSGGYGSIHRDGKSTSASRYIYEQTFGTIPDGLHVCHVCDNRLCVNPTHLFLGTAKDNVLDCKKKGRLNRTGPRGERQQCAKLTVQDVLWIRSRPLSIRKMAKILGISKSTLVEALLGRSWKHVTT